MIEWLKKLVAGFASDKLAGTVARHAATVLAGLLIGLGISPEVVGPFADSIVPVLTALFLIVVGLFGSRKAKS